MELSEFIRSKLLPNQIHFQLLEIARSENVVERLIDFIAKQDFSDNYELQGKIDELETNIKKLKEKSSEDFESFVNEFQKNNNRYPSIEETWKVCEARFENLAE